LTLVVETHVDQEEPNTPVSFADRPRKKRRKTKWAEKMSLQLTITTDQDAFDSTPTDMMITQPFADTKDTSMGPPTQAATAMYGGPNPFGLSLQADDSDAAQASPDASMAVTAPVIFQAPMVGAPVEHSLPQASVAADAKAARNKDSEYEQLGLLGRGAGGVVYCVRNRHGNLFARKVAKLSSDEKKNAGIMRELELNSRCGHPNIVQCHDSFIGNGQVHMYLEYMDGGTVTDLIKMFGKIPEPYLAKIAYQVLLGLEYLHDTVHTIHRDIKPSNILLNTRGEVKIADFGVSGLHDLSSSGNRTFVGTLKYMSPERIQGQTHRPNSDLWSVGMVVAEAALGRFPYARCQEYWAALDAIVGQQAPTLPTANSMMSDFAAKCLQKNPDQRPGVTELLKHEWIQYWKDRPVDLAALVKTYKRAQESGITRTPPPNTLSAFQDPGSMDFKAATAAGAIGTTPPHPSSSSSSSTGRLSAAARRQPLNTSAAMLSAAGSFDGIDSPSTPVRGSPYGMAAAAAHANVSTPTRSGRSVINRRSKSGSGIKRLLKKGGKNKFAISSDMPL
jgi:mitogen-activated protein kinase kinase 1